MTNARRAKIEEARKDLKSAEASKRRAAARALGDMQAKEYARDVAALLADVDTFVLGAAAEALGKLISKDERERVERYAKQLGILLHDTRQCLIYDCAKKEWKETTVSAVAEQVLREWGLGETLPPQGRDCREFLSIVEPPPVHTQGIVFSIKSWEFLSRHQKWIGISKGAAGRGA